LKTQKILLIIDKGSFTLADLAAKMHDKMLATATVTATGTVITTVAVSLLACL
jgi:hypothetical protein